MDCYWQGCTSANTRLYYRDVRLADGKYLGDVWLCATHFRYAHQKHRLLIKNEILARRIVHIKMTKG